MEATAGRRSCGVLDASGPQRPITGVSGCRPHRVMKKRDIHEICSATNISMEPRGAAPFACEDRSGFNSATLLPEAQPSARGARHR
jgi:hypothetical protein